MHVTCALTLDLFAKNFPSLINDVLAVVDSHYVAHDELSGMVTRLFFQMMEQEEALWNRRHEEALRVDRAPRARFIQECKQWELERKERFKSVYVGPFFLKRDNNTFTPNRWLEVLVRSNKVTEEDKALMQQGKKPLPLSQEQALDAVGWAIRENNSPDKLVLQVAKAFLDVQASLYKVKASLSAFRIASGSLSASLQELYTLIDTHKTLARLAAVHPGSRLKVEPIYYPDVLDVSAQTSKFFQEAASLATHLGTFITLSPKAPQQLIDLHVLFQKLSFI